MGASGDPQGPGGLQVPEPAGFVQVGGISESPGAHQRASTLPQGQRLAACERCGGWYWAQNGSSSRQPPPNSACQRGPWTTRQPTWESRVVPFPARDTDARKSQAHLSTLPSNLQPTATQTGQESQGLRLCTCPPSLAGEPSSHTRSEQSPSRFKVIQTRSDANLCLRRGHGMSTDTLCGRLGEFQPHLTLRRSWFRALPWGGTHSGDRAGWGLA